MCFVKLKSSNVQMQILYIYIYIIYVWYIYIHIFNMNLTSSLPWSTSKTFRVPCLQRHGASNAHSCCFLRLRGLERKLRRKVKQARNDFTLEKLENDDKIAGKLLLIKAKWGLLLRCRFGPQTTVQKEWQREIVLCAVRFVEHLIKQLCGARFRNLGHSWWRYCTKLLPSMEWSNSLWILGFLLIVTLT